MLSHGPSILLFKLAPCFFILKIGNEVPFLLKNWQKECCYSPNEVHIQKQFSKNKTKPTIPPRKNKKTTKQNKKKEKKEKKKPTKAPKEKVALSFRTHSIDWKVSLYCKLMHWANYLMPKSHVTQLVLWAVVSWQNQ